MSPTGRFSSEERGRPRADARGDGRPVSADGHPHKVLIQRAAPNPPSPCLVNSRTTNPNEIGLPWTASSTDGAGTARTPLGVDSLVPPWLDRPIAARPVPQRSSTANGEPLPAPPPRATPRRPGPRASTGSLRLAQLCQANIVALIAAIPSVDGVARRLRELATRLSASTTTPPSPAHRADGAGERVRSVSARCRRALLPASSAVLAWRRIRRPMAEPAPPAKRSRGGPAGARGRER